MRKKRTAIFLFFLIAISLVGFLDYTPIVIEEPEVPVVVAVPIEEPDECEGCRENRLCLDVGIRFEDDGKPMFCGVDKDVHRQKNVGNSCQNNFECLSNQCSNGQCIDIGKELQEQRGILESIAEFFRWLFGER